MLESLPRETVISVSIAYVYRLRDNMLPVNTGVYERALFGGIIEQVLASYST